MYSRCLCPLYMRAEFFLLHCIFYFIFYVSYFLIEVYSIDNVVPVSATAEWLSYPHMYILFFLTPFSIMVYHSYWM